ncbi:MAG: hypothetical protein KC613_11395, partial [Myxococcales bacterium]|nr:hypothetical protein [Myxococcales bacterium]
RADWQAAAQAVKADLRPGDGVTVLPEWAGEARLALHGLPAFLTPEPAQADWAAYDRVWVLGGWGHGVADVGGEHKVLEQKAFGAATLELVQVGGEKVLGDLRAELDRARVERQHGQGRIERCDFWDGRGWHCRLRKSPDATRACLAQDTRARHAQRKRDPHCGLDPWLNVSRDFRVIGDQPRDCVWLHPIQGGEVRVAWPAPAGEVVLRYGFTDQVIDAHDRADTRTRPATLTLKRGEAVLGTHTVEPQRGWHEWRVASPQAGDLVLSASTPSQIDAHLCVALSVRGPR